MVGVAERCVRTALYGVAVAASILSYPAISQAITGTEVQITNDPAHQYNPAVGGGIVVYTDTRHGNTEIYMYDLATGMETRLTNDPDTQILQDTDDGLIVYTDFENNGSTINAEIYLFDTTTMTATNISNDPDAQQDPVISNGLVAWEDHRHGNDDVYAYEIASATTQRITSDTAQEFRADVDGNWIVWERVVSATNSDIYIQSLGGSPTPLTTDSAAQVFPSVDGHYVVWQDNRDGDWDIYLYDLNTNTEVLLNPGDPFNQTRPRISGNLVVWEDDRNGNPDLYGFDIATATEFALVVNSSDQTLHDIDGYNVVYTDNRAPDGNLDIYMFMIDPPNVDPGAFCADLGDLSTFTPSPFVEVALAPTRFERMAGPPMIETATFNADAGDWVTCVQNGAYQCDTESETVYASFVTDDNFYGVDDTTGFTMSNNEADTVGLGTSSLTIGKGAATVTAYRGNELGELTHRGNRGLGVTGNNGCSDEYDEIDSYSQPERIEIEYNEPHAIHYIEVRSHFTNEQSPGTERGTIDFYLEGNLVHTEDIAGTLPLGTPEGEVWLDFPADEAPVADRVVFRVKEGQPYTHMSEFAVARIEASVSGGPCKRVSSANLWLDDALIAGPNAFSQNVDGLALPVTLAGSTHALDVELMSQPTSYLWVTVARPGVTTSTADANYVSPHPDAAPTVESGGGCTVAPTARAARWASVCLALAGMLLAWRRRRRG